MNHTARRTAPLLLLLCLVNGATTARADDRPPLFELHLWSGNTAVDSGSFGLRSGELASWVTRRDRISVAYDDSLSLDNPALARAGLSAEAWSANYLHDFSGNYLVSAGVGARDLADGGTQDIYKFEMVRLRNDRVAKFGAQVSPTRYPGESHTDGVIYGSLNFPLSRRWRLEPALFLGRSGLAQDDEWRLAGYAEYNARNGSQLGFGVSGGRVRSDFDGVSGNVVAAHARLSWPLFGKHQVHLQVRHESAPGGSYTLGLVGFSLRLYDR